MGLKWPCESCKIIMEEGVDKFFKLAKMGILNGMPDPHSEGEIFRLCDDCAKTQLRRTCP